MKKWFILLWLLCPVALVYLHFQFSPQFQFEAQVARELNATQAQENTGYWSGAVEHYDTILEHLSDYRHVQENRTDATSKQRDKKQLEESPRLKALDRLEIRIKLARAKALTNAAAISTATTILDELLFDLEEKDINDQLTDEIRNNLAICQYYIAWHMRLEGLLREDWLPELESSRQLFKYLAEKSLNNNDDKQAADLMKNLEAVICLERMDLPALRKLKLPDQGAGKGESQAGQKRKKNKQKSQKKQKQKQKKKGKSKGDNPLEDSRKSGFKEYKLPPGS